MTTLPLKACNRLIKICISDWFSLADNLSLTIAKVLLSVALTAMIACYAHGQTSQGDHSEFSGSEYEISSIFIADAFVGKAGVERVAFPVSQIIIVDKTQYDESGITEEMPWNKVRKFLRKQVPSLQLATIDNFREANKWQVPLQQRFSLPLPYQLVAEGTIGSIIHEISDWPHYYKQYPGAQGFLTLSRIGFSPGGEQAMFYVTNYCGGKCATGSFVVAQKQGEKWKIVREIVYWVS